jgi:hypothetical protein
MQQRLKRHFEINYNTLQQCALLVAMLCKIY